MVVKVEKRAKFLVVMMEAKVAMVQMACWGITVRSNRPPARLEGAGVPALDRMDEPAHPVQAAAAVAAAVAQRSLVVRLGAAVAAERVAVADLVAEVAVTAVPALLSLRPIRTD